MTTKRKSFSDDFNKDFNLYTISPSDIDPDIPNPDNPEEPEDDCEFTYLKVPCKYKCIYITLLTKLNELGVDMLNDCTAVCGGKNKFIITCWNMFQAACASYELGDIKKADLLINYIKAQLKIRCEEELIYYNVSLYVINDIGGTVDGSGKYAKDSNVIISAIPADGYEFVKWNDGDTNSIRNIIIDKNIELIAEFKIKQFNIKVSSTGNGTVTGDGIYNYGQNINIEAFPDEKYIFNKWHDGNTDNPRNIIVTEDKEYIATFINNTQNIILFGETNNITLNDIQTILNGNIEEYKEVLLNYINRNKDIIIKGISENVKEFNVNTTTHILLVPDNEIELIEIGYTTNGMYNDLLRDGYVGMDKVFNYEGIDYRVYLYYNISGSIDELIILKAKNK